MFASVITFQAGTEGFRNTISFWETREQMEELVRGTSAGIHDQGIEARGLTSSRLETYEVNIQA
jgi:hypothetical protein